MTDDELLGDRRPVRVRPTPGKATTADPGKRATAEKLARRLAALPAGRYELILSIDEAGVMTDWSVRYFGKIEAP